jgi:hypothetical protein
MDPTLDGPHDLQHAEAIAHLLSCRTRQPLSAPDPRAHLRRVVFLASSSRGGSSVMAEILRSCPSLLHLRAEINPFLALAGYSWPGSGEDGDRLGASQDERAFTALGQLLAQDIGRPTHTLEDRAAVERFGIELHWRLGLQWPLERFDLGWVQRQLTDTLARLERHHGWAPGTFPDAPRFHALFLAAIRHRHAAINPWYYDLPPALIREHCPDAEPSDGPPSPVVLEEPPFVTVIPWRAPTAAEYEQLPLVIKTPSNAYRLSFFQRLFPHARIEVLHLTRNAAASVNGLVDGWRFRGFFAHRVDRELSLEGYSDRFPAWARRWWKFDLPPGWQGWTRRPLVEVCGFQWRSTHRAILDWLREHPQAPRHRLAFERVVGAHDQRIGAFQSLTDWLAVPFESGLQRLVETGLPPIMATSRPRHRRWYDKADLLEPVLSRDDTRAVMLELGYSPDPETWS